MILTRYKTALPGLLFCGLIAFIASLLGELKGLQQYGLSALTVAIIIGMIIGNTYYPKVEPFFQSGVLLSKQQLLRLGVILYGFRLTFQDIANVGIEGIICGVLVLCSTLFLAVFIGIKLFKLTKEGVILIGAGSSICGAAAVMAADGVVDAKAEEVSVAVSTVVVFGSVAIFLYPWLYQLNLDGHWLSIDPTAFGVYVGSTVHEVAQVVAAGTTISDEVSNVAVITKMVRVMMLAPFLLLLPFFYKAPSSSTTIGKKAAIPIPWFAFLFIGMAIVNSLQILPASLVNVLIMVDTVFLAMAMTALGLTTHLSSVRKAGAKPLLLALILFVWLIVGGAVINRLIFAV